ncbi:MAG: hypothetical protein K5739_06635 [Lachnospiraceae bacterium]|nr:hypothetical protein [Lachnospiraceae bacterium]
MEEKNSNELNGQQGAGQSYDSYDSYEPYESYESYEPYEPYESNKSKEPYIAYEPAQERANEPAYKQVRAGFSSSANTKKKNTRSNVIIWICVALFIFYNLFPYINQHFSIISLLQEGLKKEKTDDFSDPSDTTIENENAEDADVPEYEPLHRTPSNNPALLEDYPGYEYIVEAVHDQELPLTLRPVYGKEYQDVLLGGYYLHIPMNKSWNCAPYSSHIYLDIDDANGTGAPGFKGSVSVSVHWEPCEAYIKTQAEDAEKKAIEKGGFSEEFSINGLRFKHIGYRTTDSKTGDYDFGKDWYYTLNHGEHLLIEFANLEGNIAENQKGYDALLNSIVYCGGRSIYDSPLYLRNPADLEKYAQNRMAYDDGYSAWKYVLGEDFDTYCDKAFKLIEEAKETGYDHLEDEKKKELDSVIVTVNSIYDNYLYYFADHFSQNKLICEIDICHEVWDLKHYPVIEADEENTTVPNLPEEDN